MRVRILVSIAVLFLLPYYAELSAGRPANSLKFSLADTGQILVPAMVNGSGPFVFVLDTGSNRSAISDALAARLSLQPVAVTEIVTSSGITRTPVVRLQAVSLGSHKTSDVLTPVLTAEALHAIHKQADGIIGQDVLIDAHYTLDYRRQQLFWLGSDTDSGSGTRLTVRRAEGRLLVELPQSSGRDDVAWFVPDSGASVLVLFEGGGCRGISTVAIPGTVRTSTVTGHSQAQAAMVPKLRIGTDTLWDQPAVLIPGVSAPAAGTDEVRVDGLLPLARFSSVTFNGRENYMKIGK